MKSSCLRLSREGAFTVIEVLVATAVTAVLAALLLTLVVNVTGVWSRSHGALTVEGQARLASDQLARDLETAMYSNDGNTWLTVDFAGDDAEAIRDELAPEEKGQIANARFGQTGSRLRLIVSSPASTSGVSAPVAIGYVLRSRSAADGRHYELFRAEVSSQLTFEQGYDLRGTAAYLTATLAVPQPSDLIADNVVDFGVWLYARESDGSLTRLFPEVSSTTYSGRSPSSDTTASDRFPNVVDVMMRVLTPEGMRILNAPNAPAEKSIEWWRLVSANSRVFTRRVVVASSSF